MSGWRKIWWLALACLIPGAAHAVEVQFIRIAEGIYAHIGDTAGRSYDNEALNANVGLIVTSQGSILIDSGASYQSARQIEQAARKVSAQPIRWVINTGGQDQRWLGNGYFKSQGAEIVAHARARADMAARAGDQLNVLREVLRDRFVGTEAVFPTRLIDTPDAELSLGGVRLALRHRGGGHTPGDMMVWLPDQGVLFSGDIVYTDRLLGVIPVSNTRAWLAMFDLIEEMKPRTIVPGHGRPTDLAGAQRSTRDYLRALRLHMRKAVDDGTDVSTATRTFNASAQAAPFKHLRHADDLMPGNASWTYMEIERD